MEVKVSSFVLILHPHDYDWSYRREKLLTQLDAQPTLGAYGREGDLSTRPNRIQGSGVLGPYLLAAKRRLLPNSKCQRTEGSGIMFAGLVSYNRGVLGD